MTLTAPAIKAIIERNVHPVTDHDEHDPVWISGFTEAARAVHDRLGRTARPSTAEIVLLLGKHLSVNTSDDDAGHLDAGYDGEEAAARQILARAGA